MAAEWRYSKDGQQHGPVSASDLMNLVESGDLLPTDLIWTEGMAEWKQAGKSKGLFPPTSESATKSPRVPSDPPKKSTPRTDELLEAILLEMKNTNRLLNPVSTAGWLITVLLLLQLLGLAFLSKN